MTLKILYNYFDELKITETLTVITRKKVERDNIDEKTEEKFVDELTENNEKSENIDLNESKNIELNESKIESKNIEINESNIEMNESKNIEPKNEENIVIEENIKNE
jgi:hypothetical protein